MTAILTAQQRPLSEIAQDIRKHWPKVYFGAVPYLDALDQLDKITDKFYEDDAEEIVIYLLGNLQTFKGPDARRIKAELKKLSSYSN